MIDDSTELSRAQGCLMGQLVGDALGSLVEFQTPERIRAGYPDGVRDLADGGTWNTLAGQPTDDSEMALMLTRSLLERQTYDADHVLASYRYWLNSDPFDMGQTTYNGLHDRHDHNSQANGALMRVSPLGVFGSRYPLEQVADWAKQDAALTHPHAICQQANALYTMAIAQAIRLAPEPQSLYADIVGWADELSDEQALLQWIREAETTPPEDYVRQQGWVRIALQNALWQLLHAPSLEEGIVDTVMRGGDTDTNAAICGALLGAVHGLEAMPSRWIETIQLCMPQQGLPGVNRPRPQCFWPVDALDLAERLLSGGEQINVAKKEAQQNG